MKKLLTIFLSLFIVLGLLTQVSANEIKLIDEANVLSETDKQDINNLINQYVELTNYDIVVYFTYDNDYYKKYDFDHALTYFADDFYDNNGYGVGTDYSGIIMVVDVYQRDYTITTCGECTNCYTDYGLDNIYSYVTEHLRQDDWAGAAKQFVKQAYNVYVDYDYYHGFPDINPSYQEEKNPVKDALVFAAIGSSIITLIAFIIFAKQLKTTGVKTTATNYVKGANINIFRSGEVYLYTSVSRTRIERNNSSSSSHSSHSSTHVSSSGRSHGGGGSHRF